MTDPMFGLEDWQKQFVRQWQRTAERADGNLPDAADFELYYENDYNDLHDE